MHKMDNKKPTIGTIRQLWPFLQAHRKRLFLALFASMVGVAAMLGVVQTVRLLVDNTLSMPDTSALGQTLALFLIFVGLMAAATYFRVVHFKMVGEYVVMAIRQKVFAHVLGLDAKFFEEQRIGDVSSRLTSDIAVMQHALEASLPIALRGLLQMLGGMALMVWTSSHLSVVILAVVAIVMVLAVIFGQVVRRYGRQMQSQVSDAAAQITESLQGIKVVQSYGQQPQENDKFAATLDKQLQIARKYNKARGLFFAFATSCIFGAVAVVLWFGGQDVVAETMTTGHLAAFLMYSLITALGIGSLIEVFSSLQTAAGATERLFSLLDAKSTITDPKNPKVLPKSGNGRSIVFNDLTFAYPNSPEKNALTNINFKVDNGEMVAIVGMSGAGKSTIFQLIMRFFDPQQGSISIDGIDIRSLRLNELRQNIGIVSQDVFLFAGNVLDNIRYGKPEASDEEVFEAAKLAQAHDFIEQLPQGYNTIIGERGVRLSGGQRQRLAIARTILCRPPVLLLDEATSHLDAASEQAVQKALAELHSNRTTITIAHRLSTVKTAKHILLIDDGKLIVQGSHSQLMKSNPLYKKLATLQFISE